MRVIALPVDHRVQRGVPPERPSIVNYCTAQQERGFLALLRLLIRKHGVKLLAEEFHEDALRQARITETTCSRLARELGIKSRSVDLTEQQLNALDTLSTNQIDRAKLPRDEFERKNQENYRIREQHWTRQILELSTWPCLFIYGGLHTKELIHRMHGERLEVLLLPEWDKDTRTLRDYLSETT